MEILLISTEDVSRMLWLALGAFAIAFIMTPAFTNFLYKNKLGKRIRDSKDAPIYTA